MWAKILLLFFVFSFLFKTDHSFDQDLGRHLKLGEIIWQTQRVPLTNLFSYTYPDFPFINSHWLFEVLAYLASQTTGLQFLLIVKIFIFLISVWLILKIIPKENSVLLLPVGFIFLHVLKERLELRPEIFSFLFTAVTYFTLSNFTKLVLLLPVLQLLWINTHIYFPIGLILQAIFLLHLSWRYLRFHLEGVKLKLLTMIFVLSVALSFINPSGLKGVLNPFLYSTNYGYTIVENQTMFFLESINFKDPNFLFVKLSAGLVGLSLLVAIFRRQWQVKNILLSVGGLALALMNVRSFPYLVFLSLPATLQNFGPIKHGTIAKILAFVFGGLLILESYFYLNGEYYLFRDDYNQPGLRLVESGKGAMDFVLANDLPQPIFNNFDIGSYITYRGWPKYRVFVDGRPGEYPKEFFSNTYIPMQSDYSKFKDFKKQFGFNTIIFSHTDQTPWGKAFLASVVKDDDWKTVYLDDFIIILVRTDILFQTTLKPLSLSKLDPSLYSFNSYLSYLKLALFLAQTQNLESAQKFAEKGLSLSPQSPLGNALFGINIQNKFFW